MKKREELENELKAMKQEEGIMFDGHVDSISVYDRRLSHIQIRELYLGRKLTKYERIKYAIKHWFFKFKNRNRKIIKDGSKRT